MDSGKLMEKTRPYKIEFHEQVRTLATRHDKLPLFVTIEGASLHVTDHYM